ncbi:MAG: type II toxin-antitoxin system VapC family toxin [Candidatus Limnocylindrales bacterium]
MRFWDSSAVVPLLVEEVASDGARHVYAEDPGIVTWWGTRIVCVSAFARRERDGGGPAPIAVVRRLAELTGQWQEVQASEVVRSTAVRLLRTHPLRTGDALQLAAAIVTADGDPGTLPFVTLDDRMALAADREGFPVIVPGAGA